VPIPQEKFQVPDGIKMVASEDWYDDEQIKWHGVPEETRKEVQDSPQYKTLEENGQFR
jgi:hypothetical protein